MGHTLQPLRTPEDSLRMGGRSPRAQRAQPAKGGSTVGDKVLVSVRVRQVEDCNPDLSRLESKAETTPRGRIETQEQASVVLPAESQKVREA